jgi:stress responsive alpha/beta barrel protein
MQRVFATMMTLALGFLLTTAPSLSAQAASPPAGTLRHIVVFKYKPGATEAQIKQVTDAFVALKTKIPGVVSIEHGVNNSPEKRNQGFTHVYQVTFTNAAARDAYLPHPAHKEFGALLGKLGVLEDVFVVDYTPMGP